MDRKDFYLTTDDIKINTKEYMSGSWIKHAKTTLLFFVLVAILIAGTVCSYVFLDWYYSVIITLVAVFMYSQFSYGYNHYCLESIKGEVGAKLIFSGFGKSSFKIFLSFVMTLVVEAVGFALFIAPGVYFSLKYSIKDFVIAENKDLSAVKYLSKSSKLMKVNYSRLLDLFGSFCPLFLSGLLSLGIAMIWILPYYTMSKANFYEDLKTDF